MPLKNPVILSVVEGPHPFEVRGIVAGVGDRLQKYEVFRLRALPPSFRQGAALKMTGFLGRNALLR